jgi:ankyrin repeat protein
MEARLSVSIRDNDAVAVKRLLDRGADLKAYNRKGFASIHVACAHDSDRVLDILLQRNPLLALEPAKDKSLPVEVAITHGSTGCIHVLARHKLLFNPTYTTNKSTPLTLALTASNLSPSQRLATVATLTGLGANVNEPVCPYMMTPLMIAIVQDTGIPIVSFLLKNGASTTVSDISGETALHKAIKYHFYSYYMLLAE